MILTAKQKALKLIADSNHLSENMAARRIEKLVFSRFTASIPNWKEIKVAGGQLAINKSIDNPFREELDRFNNLNETRNLDGLIARYPLRRSGVFDQIAKALECGKREVYERMVVARMRDDESLVRKLKERISPLAKLLDAQTSHD